MESVWDLRNNYRCTILMHQMKERIMEMARWRLILESCVEVTRTGLLSLAKDKKA